MSNDSVETKRVLRLVEYVGPIEEIDSMLADTLSGRVTSKSKVGNITIRTVVTSGPDALLKMFHEEFERGVEVGKQSTVKPQPNDSWMEQSVKSEDDIRHFYDAKKEGCNCTQDKTASDLCPVHGSR